MGKIAAFFDIDGTLFRSSLQIKHFKRLVKYEIIDESVWRDHIKPLYEKYDKRFGEYDQYLLALANIYMEKLVGINHHYIDYIAKQVVDANADVVYKYTRSRIQFHKNSGHAIFFISGSPSFLVRLMAEKYGATEYRGTEYEIDEKGSFTGKVKPMWDSANKRDAVMSLVKKHEVYEELSYAYGDTSGDLSMLRLMGHSVAVNPTHELLTTIREDSTLKEKVDVIVERKDVVYKVNGDVDFTKL